jgi:hypothetical protein
MEEDNTIVKLKSMPDENGDSLIFEVSMAAASISEMIRDAVQDDDDAEFHEVDVPRVKGDCLGKVVDFMKHYHEEKMKEIPTPLGGSTFEEVGCFSSRTGHSFMS